MSAHSPNPADCIDPDLYEPSPSTGYRTVYYIMGVDL